jgi:non-homologous end joining protein Ku
MPPRAVWKGSISFGLVTVPITLVTATEARESLVSTEGRRLAT